MLRDDKVDIGDLELDKIPKHIAIIMDGNGRWAKKEIYQEVLDIKLVLKL